MQVTGLHAHAADLEMQVKWQECMQVAKTQVAGIHHAVSPRSGDTSGALRRENLEVFRPLKPNHKIQIP
jgi:hypothetical protein